MTEIICGKCGEKFQSETEQDSDEYCPTCIKEMKEAARYPEHEKLRAIQEQSQWLGSFIDWFTSTKGCRIAKYFRYYKGSMEPVPEDVDADDEDIITNFMPISLDINGILAEYFDIDLKKIELEKRAMLEEIRQHNSPV